MPKLRSLLANSMAYDGGVEARRAGQSFRVEIKPGVNELSDEDARNLGKDEIFLKHFRRGFYQAIPEPEAPPPEPEAPPPPAASKPAAKGKAAADPVMDKFVADFLALKPEEQAAMSATLTPEQSAAVEAAKAKAK